MEPNVSIEICSRKFGHFAGELGDFVAPSSSTTIFKKSSKNGE
jgi:hypothetical protein